MDGVWHKRTRGSSAASRTAGARSCSYARVQYVTANEWSSRRYLDMFRLNDRLMETLITAPWTGGTTFAQLFGHKGLRTFSWRLSGRIVAVSGREERERAVELYFSTSMSTKQVVEHLGYPTRQCPGTVAARRSQVCGCRSQAAHTVGDAVSRGGIVPVWYAAEAGGDGAWRQRRCGASLDETVPRRWNGGAGDRNGGMPCRRPEPIASRWAMTRMCCVGGYGSWSRGNALMREVVRGRRKRPGRRPAAPVEPGEDDAGRPAEAEVFAEVADMLAAVSRPAATTTTTRERGSISTGPCAAASRTCSANRGAGTGIGGSRPRSGRVSRRR